MTVATERFRALRWAREWLRDAALDPLVSPQARAEVAALLSAYPSDERIRALISSQVPSFPPDVAESLSAASAWLFAFRHPTSTPARLPSVLRHLPTSGEIATWAQVPDHEGALVDLRLFAGVHHWLCPDEDYVRAFVVGWLDDCAAASGMDWADSGEADLLEKARPLFLITSHTSGVQYARLELRQRLLCTVPRQCCEDDREWRYVKSCDVCHEAPDP